MTDQPQNDPQNTNPEPQPVVRRKRTFPACLATNAVTGEKKLFYRDEWLEIMAQQAATVDGETAARDAELAAGRPQPVGPPSQPPTDAAPPTTRPEVPHSSPCEEADAALKSFSTSVSHSSPTSNFTPPPDYSRHSRCCRVCAHPDRDAIEGDYVRWRSPIAIAKDYNLADRSSVYRHAHATGLDRRRTLEIRRVMERFLEEAEHFPVEQFDVVTRAVRVYAHLDDDGRWWEPSRTNYVLSGPFWPDVPSHSTRS